MIGQVLLLTMATLLSADLSDKDAVKAQKDALLLQLGLVAMDYLRADDAVAKHEAEIERLRGVIRQAEAGSRDRQLAGTSLQAHTEGLEGARKFKARFLDVMRALKHRIDDERAKGPSRTTGS